MSFSEWFSELWPFYLAGTFSIFMVFLCGNKHLLRIEKKPLLTWLKILGYVTIFRIVVMKLTGQAHHHGFLPPIGSVFFVWWEDFCFIIPLVILQNWLSNKGWWKMLYYPCLLLSMAIFGRGHMYQGIYASLLLSLYIPVVKSIGQKVGYGTTSCCHILYDLATLLFVKVFLG